MYWGSNVALETSGFFVTLGPGRYFLAQVGPEGQGGASPLVQVHTWKIWT